VIEPRYLLLERAGKPVAELKWNRIRGRFAPGRMLRRLSAGQRPAIRKSLHPEPLPSSWARVLSGRQHTGFTWQTPDAAGRGVLLFCPQCSTATLIQFLDALRDQGVAVRLLKSFQDHFSPGGVPWSIYDISAVIPDDYQLTHYRLEAGFFELAYGGPGRTRLRLLRWAPASVLLQNMDLAEFFADRLQAELRVVQWTAGRTLEASWGGEARGPLRWIRRGRSLHCRARLWHLPEKNRILGVRLESARLPERELFERICNHYGVV